MPARRSETTLLLSVNALSVLEQTAFFAAYIVMGLYLVEVAGFDDVGAGWVAGGFGMGLCLLPAFAGAVADRAGFRPSLTVAYVLQAAGFALLAVGRSPGPAVAGLALVAAGGATTRSILMGTVGRTDPSRRARAYSLLMQAINVGCFLGKVVARPLRLDLGLVSVEWFAAGMFLLSAGLAWATIRIPADAHADPGARLWDTLRGMGKVLGDGRFVAMIVQVGLFWAVQNQMYVTMPRFVVRLAGPGSSPEWYAALNPLVVVLLILPVNHLTRAWSTRRILWASFGILAAATVAMGSGPWLVTVAGGTLPLAGVEIPTQAVALIAGCSLSGLAECFLIPHFLDRIAALAPPGQAALYQGYSYLTGLVSNFAGWGLSGYLLDRWCPDPAATPGAQEALALAATGAAPWPEAWAHAPGIFVFWAVVAVLAVALMPDWKRPGNAVR